jgi:putative flippase GtrA
MRADVAHRLLPLVEDTAWFFDTELLVLAERSGLRVHEVPVDWVDDPDSRVHIISTATADLRGVARLLRDRRRLRPGPSGGPDRSGGPRPGPIGGRRLGGQVLRFAAIGVASTLAYVALYALLREWLDAAPSNALALIATAVGNTAANRRLTFDIRGGEGAVRAQAAGFLALGIALAITSLSIAALAGIAPRASRVVEIAVLVTANAVATAARFLVLRRFIARPVPVTLAQ